jgi:transcription initiation factor TFIIIB Brf1 subunit/transcription initiation factor TFIIB
MRLPFASEWEGCSLPNGLPFSALALAALLLASLNPDVEQRLETIATAAQNTKEAIRNVRQGMQNFNQGVIELQKLRG